MPIQFDQKHFVIDERNITRYIYCPKIEASLEMLKEKCDDYNAQLTQIEMPPAFFVTKIHQKFELIIAAEDFYRIKLPDSLLPKEPTDVLFPKESSNLPVTLPVATQSKATKLEDRIFHSVGKGYFGHVVNVKYGWDVLRQFRLAAEKVGMNDSIFISGKDDSYFFILMTDENHQLWSEKIEAQKEIFKDIDNTIMQNEFEQNPENAQQYRRQFCVFYLKKLCWEFNKKIRSLGITQEKCFSVGGNYIIVDKENYETMKSIYNEIRKINETLIEDIQFFWDSKRKIYSYVPAFGVNINNLQDRCNTRVRELSLNASLVFFHATTSCIYIDEHGYVSFLTAVLIQKKREEIHCIKRSASLCHLEFEMFPTKREKHNVTDDLTLHFTQSYHP